ncbi:MAG: NYN domain-containing protein, partial [Chloroflexota bacterium]
KDIRKFGDGRVKANLDIELVVDLFRLADRMDIAVIVSGDGDFAPAIRALQDKGVRCEVISFRPNTSSDLIAVADEFIDIMKIIGIGRGKDADKAASKVMSAPPMPAKEVVPEFGFREAPAAVAAAALAAIREGGAKPASRGRGRSAPRPEPVFEAMAPGTEEPPEAATVAADGTTDGATDGATGEARRRRRRRGGRGRGRGRGRTDEVTATAPASDAPIGWTELDDISQAGSAEADEAREYSFEEADAATLAELGLSSDDVAALAIAAPEASDTTEAKPRRSRKPASAPATDATEKAAKPTRGRSRTAAAAKAPEESAEAASATPKPPGRTAKAKEELAAEASPAKPRTRSRAKAAPEPALTEGAEEGIWQRFRGARTKTP